MEKKLYDAAFEGDKISLLNLLQHDPLLLDRFITGHYPETPLHVASMLGHFEFVDEVVTRKPELAKEVDFRNSSPLHLAAAKGYLEVVKRLLLVNPDMCHACDIDGRNPIHIAAVKGHLHVLTELVRARPLAAQQLMDQSETILHACVRRNQLEALKLLVDRVSDHKFVNCKNFDGNTVLHLAIAANQTEAINFLISTTTVDVNCVNEDGFAALDLLSQNQRDLKEKEIAESLRRIGATYAKDKASSNDQLKAIRMKMLLSTTCDQSKAILKPKKRKNGTRVVKRNVDWLEKKRDTLMVVASLLAAMAFQAAVNPPSFVEKDKLNIYQPVADPPSGFEIQKLDKSLVANLLGIDAYSTFLICNTMGFLASLTIIHLLISGLPLRRRLFLWVLMVILWVAIDSMAFAYVSAIAAFISEHERNDDLQERIPQILTIGFFCSGLDWLDAPTPFGTYDSTDKHIDQVSPKISHQIDSIYNEVDQVSPRISDQIDSIDQVSTKINDQIDWAYQKITLGPN